MAGPVCVLDAQGTPLMPLAPAHARKLVGSGRAHFRPHPALTIIQLTRIVERPVLRPVLIGITLHRTTAELIALAAGPHAVFPLFYVVVNLGSRTHVPRHYTRRRIRSGALVRGYARDIRAGLAEFLPFVPISHIVILPLAAQGTMYPGIRPMLQHVLTSRERSVTLVRRNGPAPCDVPETLYAALISYLDQPSGLAPTLVVQPMVALSGARRWRQRTLHHPTGLIAPGIGVIGNPPLTGIYYDYPQAGDWLRLHVPVAASSAGVVWRHVKVTLSATFQWFPLVGVALLPLSTVTTQPGIVPYEDDPADEARPF